MKKEMNRRMLFRTSDTEIVRTSSNYNPVMRNVRIVFFIPLPFSNYEVMKRIFSVIGFFALTLTLAATPISHYALLNEAKQMFLQKASLSAVHVGTPEVKDCGFVVRGGDTVLAVVNFSKGFIILDVTDEEASVRAYSFTYGFDLDNLPPAAKLWLDLYAQSAMHSDKQANDLSSNCGIVSNDGGNYAAYVRPLVTAVWDQTKYYNSYSPVDAAADAAYDYRTPNGCVAVAMAMIMYYYRYPRQGTGSHTNYSSYGNYYVNFSQQNYFYESMCDKLDYYNDEVAKLIFHCATSVDMMYGPNGSGSYSFKVPDAMIDHFGYANTCQYVTRNSYGNEQWKNLLKEELNAGRPMYYSGSNDEGGHAFVCDGYNSDDFFHFNFGWGGNSNGYYMLQNNDTVQNAIGGYSSGQAAVIGIYPADNSYPYHCSEQVVKSSNGSLEDGSNSSSYPNNAHCTYVITADSMISATVNLQYLHTQARHDSLSFWNRHPNNGDLLLSLSGDVENASYHFDTDSLYITFTSDEAETGEGWRLEYSVEQETLPCGGLIIRDYSGTISKWGTPSGYHPNARCFWLLKLPEATQIAVSFSKMDISPEDRLYFYDRYFTPSRLLASYTGSTLPLDAVFNTQNLSVLFVSDNYKEAKGFEFSWQADGDPAGIPSEDSPECRIYPNPASDFFCLQLPDNFQTGIVKVYDLLGKMVCYADLKVGNNNTIHVHNWPNGLYLVNIIVDNKVFMQKINIQH